MEPTGIERSRADQLADDVASLRAAMEALEARRRRRPGWRRIAVAAVAVLSLAIPAVVLANHRFTDVPTGSTFHNNISNIAQAGITTGCGVGLYCPSDPVRRDQMAAFLNRGLGRGASGSGVSAVISSQVVVASLTINAPGAGFVHVTADAMGYTEATTGCPCEIDLELYSPDLDESSLFFAGSLQNAGVTESWVAIGNNYVFQVPAAGTYTFEALMFRITGTALVWGDAAMSALWVPFNSTGGAAFPSMASGSSREVQRH